MNQKECWTSVAVFLGLILLFAIGAGTARADILLSGPSHADVGQEIAVSFQPEEGNEGYRVLIMFQENDGASGFRQVSEQEIPAASQDTVWIRHTFDAEGNAIINVWDKAKGIYLQKSIYVGEIVKVVSLSANYTEVIPYKTVQFTCSAPHADAVRLYRARAEQPDDWTLLNSYTNLAVYQSETSFSAYLNGEGTYLFRAEADFDGEPLSSDTVTVRVAPDTNVRLAAPEVTVSRHVEAGQPLSVQITPVENAEVYHIRAYCREWTADQAFDSLWDMRTIPAEACSEGWSRVIPLSPSPTLCWITVYADSPMAHSSPEVTAYFFYAGDAVPCGENVSWTLDENGLLTISGTGGMYPNTRNGCPFPTEQVKKAVVGEGVTGLCDSVFSWCSNLAEVQLPSTLRTIPNSAFSSCGSLPAVALPGHLTAIGNYAFSYCRALMEIILPDGVTEIGKGAFQSCYALESAMLPPTLAAIPDDLFAWCSHLSAVAMPTSAAAIGNSAFYGCGMLERLQIPADVSSIGSYAFYGCDALTELTLPDGVESIGHSAFEDCASLASVRLPAGLTTIEDWLFYGCESLASIELPETVTSIGEGAFEGCRALTYLRIPAGVTSIGEGAFGGCSNLRLELAGENADYVTVDGVLFSRAMDTLISYPAWKTDASYTVPAGVTAIGSYAFCGCEALEELVLPEGLETIGAEAFEKCAGLRGISLPASLRVISDGVFIDCARLAEVHFSTGLEYIGASAFAGCGSLRQIDLPEGLTQLDYWALAQCAQLTTISIPRSLTIERSPGFYGCDSLREILIPADHPTLKYVDGALIDKRTDTMIAFAPGWCVGAYTVPDCVRVIANSAFDEGLMLTDIILPEGLTGLARDAFGECLPVLKTITFPRSLTDFDYLNGIYDMQTAYCYRDSKIYGYLKERQDRGYLQNCRIVLLDDEPIYTPAKIMTLPKGLTEIEAEAFRGTAADLYKLPDGAKRVGSLAFADLQGADVYVVLPDNMAYIAPDAFQNSDVILVIWPHGYALDYAEEHEIPWVSIHSMGNG